MLDQEEIDQQKKLLDVHRATLFHYIHQRAILGSVNITPGVTHGILEARQNIRRIKYTLRVCGLQIEDFPDDEDYLSGIYSDVCQERIKIAILGANGSGKTAYLLGTYAFSQVNTGTFRIVASKQPQHNHLIKYWNDLISMSSASRWPNSKSSDAINYSFELICREQSMLGIEWLDYRGDALYHLSSEIDAKILFNHVNSSSCALICISRDLLYQDKATESQTARQIGRIMVVLSQAISKGNLISLAIIITKFHDDVIVKDKLITSLKALMPALFSSQLGLPILIHTSSLKTLSTNVSRPEDPIIFAAYFYLRKRIKQLESAARPDSDLEVLRKKIDLLKFGLRDATIYYNGEQLSVTEL